MARVVNPLRTARRWDRALERWESALEWPRDPEASHALARRLLLERERETSVSFQTAERFWCARILAGDPEAVACLRQVRVAELAFLSALSEVPDR
jgi:hypothetical protein